MKKESLRIDIASKRIHAKLLGIQFKEGDYDIIYIPSLQISGYGQTIKEAHELVRISLEDFSETLFKHNEYKVFEVLKKLGWERNKFFNKRMSNLSETTFEDIRREFNLPNEIELQEIPIAV